MPRQTDARERMIRSAALLFRERGVDGTSFNDVIAHSGAPRGSIYHHFEGGKAQLAAEATQWAGEVILAGLADALAEDDVPAAIARLDEQWTRTLERSDFRAGCPIVAAAVEGDREPAARDAAAAAFARWQDVLAGALRARGLTPERASSIAALVVAGIEGAIVLARAQRSTEPLHRVTGELGRLVELASA
ncbi:MAG: TetR/AcrR family transcriptional regulator [Solirubrobacterales bacterium]|nr:TetR/AcrR family transcriptional regulator [Solirubrobacterales bacterium]